ncbi:MAG: sugar phosphate isomerase/epimerase [Spirochaetia bacterium]|nr:sugar phosphate isomerase/epimerase [Spirochaetia bacterium]
MYEGNKLGICEWAMPVDGPYTCKMARELGFDGIQLELGPYERGFSKSRSAVQKAYLEMAETHGIEFPSMAVRVTDYYSMVSEPGSPEHEIVRSGIDAGIEACAAMNVPILMIPNFVKSAIRTEREFDIAVAVFQKACDKAEGLGITIAAENPLSIPDTFRFFKSIDRKNIGLYFDLQNYYLHNDAYTPDILEALFDLILELHVKDGRGKELSGALLGEGSASFNASVEVLKRHEYSKWIISENYYDMPPLCGPADDPVALIKKDVATLRSLFS